MKIPDGWPTEELLDEIYETYARAAKHPRLAFGDAMRTLLTYIPTPPEKDALEEMRQRKDTAYEERNRVVAALAKLFPSGITRTSIEGWSEDWHGCVYIDLPTGQVSWHFHDSQAHLFENLPAYTKTWDGHTTEEKYQRLAAMKVPAQENQWQQAILNECFAIEGCYKESDPTGTLTCLINWHVLNERDHTQAQEG